VRSYGWMIFTCNSHNISYIGSQAIINVIYYIVMILCIRSWCAPRATTIQTHYSSSLWYIYFIYQTIKKILQCIQNNIILYYKIHNAYLQPRFVIYNIVSFCFLNMCDWRHRTLSPEPLFQSVLKRAGGWHVIIIIIIIIKPTITYYRSVLHVCIYFCDYNIVVRHHRSAGVRGAWGSESDYKF